MQKNPEVTVLIPAVNEEKTIAKMVEDCLALSQYNIDVLVVIDSKTHDNTKVLAQKSGAKVVYTGEGLGKGTAVARAIPFVKSSFIVQIDADYQFLPREIPRLVEPLFHGVDVTLGTRYQKGSEVEKNSVSLLKYVGSFFLSGVTSIVAFQRITDVMAGFKGFKTSVLKKLDPKTPHFGYEAELVIKAAKLHYKILNIPISYKTRKIGTSNVNSIKHGLLVLQTILRLWKN